VLSGSGLCDEVITRPEEFYRLWCVVVCDVENLKNEEAMTRVGSQRHSKKKKKIPALDSCKGQLLFTRRINVDRLFVSRLCRHVLRPLPHAAFPVEVINIRTLSAFVPLTSDMTTIFISSVYPSRKTLSYRY
jgi:hypothetical protein